MDKFLEWYNDPSLNQEEIDKKEKKRRTEKEMLVQSKEKEHRSL